MITLMEATKLLNSYWPNTNKLTPEIIRQLVEPCNRRQMVFAAFEQAVLAYRELDKNAAYPPVLARDIFRYAGTPSIRYSEKKLWQWFAYLIATLGWEWARDYALKDELLWPLLRTAGVSLVTAPYGEHLLGWPPWQLCFWALLHDQHDWKAAYEHLAASGPKPFRQQARRLALLEPNRSAYRCLARTKTGQYFHEWYSQNQKNENDKL